MALSKVKGLKMKWKMGRVNEVGYLEDKDNYVSINTSIDETALRVKVKHTDREIDNYATFTVMGNHKETINTMNSDLEIMEWFAKNINGFWSDSAESLKDYISRNFTKQ